MMELSENKWKCSEGRPPGPPLDLKQLAWCILVNAWLNVYLICRYYPSTGYAINIAPTFAQGMKLWSTRFPQPETTSPADTFCHRVCSCFCFIARRHPKPARILIITGTVGYALMSRQEGVDFSVPKQGFGVLEARKLGLRCYTTEVCTLWSRQIFHYIPYYNVAYCIVVLEEVRTAAM